MKKYAAIDIKSYCSPRIYAKQGDELEIYNIDGNIACCRTVKGDMFGCSLDKLSDNKPGEAAQAPPKERAKPERSKPLTQAEKLQIEYLNSKR